MAKNEKGAGGVAERVFDLAKPLCDELGLILWDVVFEKEGTTWYLRVYIDREDEFVTIEDCESFHRPFNDILDEVDPIEQSYVFEVGGPGLGRTLRRPEHFIYCEGCEVRVKTYKPLEQFGNQKEFIARLITLEGKTLTLEYNDEMFDIPLSDCAKVSLYDDEDLF